MKEQIKNLILEIDLDLELMKGLGINASHQLLKDWRTNNTNEVVKAIDCMLLGKAYLGKTLGELGVETPYKLDGKRETIVDIEPAANKAEIAEGTYQDQKTLSYIKRVDNYRQDIEKLANKVMEYKTTPEFKWSYKANIYTTSAFQYLTEARFWLGFELGRIRENN